MSAADFSIHAVNPSAAGGAAAAATASSTASADGDGDSFFDTLLDIVNPLQHLPIVGTLYRAITGDKIGTFAKIAGDTLFGGIEGFASSIADTVFEKVTGKSFGDTVLAAVEHITGVTNDDLASIFSPHATRVAAAAPAVDPVTVTPSLLPLATAAAPVAIATKSEAAPIPALQQAVVVPGQEALLAALSRAGASGDLALRAAEAYRRSLTAPPPAAAPPIRLH